MRHFEIGKLRLTITDNFTTPDTLSSFLRGMLIAGMVTIAGCGGGGGGVAATDTTAPIFSSGASASFAENGSGTAYDATADNDSGITYTLGGTDAAKFAVNATSGAVTFQSSPNYEVPTDSGGNNVYDITVTATDAAGNATDQGVAITVTNVVEAGETDTTAPIFSSGANSSFAENGIGTAYDATADNDIGITYTLGGTDAAKFAVNATSGAVTFLSSPNYEIPTDSGGNNVYDISVTATDAAGNATVRGVAIMVTNVVEAGETDTTAPIFSSGASASFAENGTGTAYDATADNDIGITYTLGGTDAAKFAVNATSGVVTFLSSPNYEIPTDTGANNVYDITVTATDAASNATNQGVAITVTNVAEAGELAATLTAASIANNGNATVQSSDTGTAYLVKNTLAVSSLADITGAAVNQWNSAAVTTANSDTVLSVAGLQAGVYKLFTVDTVGRLSAVASNTVVVTNTTDANLIDLGADGKLIFPKYMDGNWYFFWDRSGDGTSSGVDYTTHDVLDGIFANDIDGVANTTVINSDYNYGTTDTYRYATLNGVKVALPTANGGTAYPNGINNYQLGTAIGNTTPSLGDSAVNPTYDGLLAIWDGYNGTGTGTNIYGTPPDWQPSNYWSATPSWSGHALLILSNGYLYDWEDLHPDFVALQVM